MWGPYCSNTTGKTTKKLPMLKYIISWNKKSEIVQSRENVSFYNSGKKVMTKWLLFKPKTSEVTLTNNLF